MIQNYNILKFVDDPIKLTRSREKYAYGKNVAVLTPTRRIPPFQLIRNRYANTPLTRFDLVRLSDGAVTDILSEVTASCVSILEGGDQENYSNASIVADTLETNAHSWGFTLGSSFTDFRHVVVAVNGNDQNVACTTWNAQIKDSYGGSVVATATEVRKVIDIDTTSYIYFDFGAIYDNSPPTNLYIEVTSDGQWSPVGDDALYSGQTVSYGVLPNQYPIFDRIGAEEFLGSAYLRAYAYDGNFDVIVNDGSEYDLYVPDGCYQVVISDGITTWYSEDLQIQEYIDSEMKISYWHNEPFPLPNGEMLFFDGYKNVVYLSAKLGETEWDLREEVVDQLGRLLPISRTTRTIETFKFNTSKAQLAAMNLIWMHHNIEIEVDCQLFNVHDFKIVNYEWDQEGLFATCTVEFTVDSITTAKGHNRSDNGFVMGEVSDLTFPATIDCVDVIKWDYYTDEIVDIADEPTYTNKLNKYIIVDNAGTKTLGYYNGSDVVYPAATEGQVVKYFDGSSDTYYFFDGTLKTKTVIDSVTNIGGNARRLDGNTFRSAHIVVEYEVPGPTSLFTSRYDGQELINNGIVIDQALVSKFRIHAFGGEKTFEDGFEVSDWINNV